MAKEENRAAAGQPQSPTGQTAETRGETAGVAADQPGVGTGAGTAPSAQEPADQPPADEQERHPFFLDEPPIVTPETMYPVVPGAIVETRPHMQPGNEDMDPEIGRSHQLPGHQPGNMAQVAHLEEQDALESHRDRAAAQRPEE